MKIRHKESLLLLGVALALAGSIMPQVCAQLSENRQKGSSFDQTLFDQLSEQNREGESTKERSNSFARFTKDSSSSTENVKRLFDNISENRKQRKQTYYVDQEWMVEEIDEALTYIISPYYERLQVILTTDKEIYRPNDVVFIQALVVQAFNKTPVAMSPEDEFLYNYYTTLTINDPTDSNVYTDYQYALNSTASYAYKIPEDASGGQYTIKVGSWSMPTARKTIRVQSYPRPTMNVILSLDADSYFPGESVSAKVKVSNMDGSALDSSPILSYSINFETSTVSEENIQVNRQTGEALFSFTIPSDTEILFATLGALVTLGSLEEAASKTIVISNPDLITIDFNPETGLFVPDLENKVYFATYINPERYDVVDFEGASLVKMAGRSLREEVILEDISTIHKGKGYFTFTPTDLDTYTYSLKVPIPKSKTTIYRQLPTFGQSMNEVLFRVSNKNKVLRNNENLKIEVIPNSLLDWESIYVLTVSLKEEILYSEQFQFDEKLKPESITVRDDQMDVPNGGTLQVNLYKLSDEIIAYAEYLNEVGYDYDRNQTNNGGGSIDWGWEDGTDDPDVIEVEPRPVGEDIPDEERVDEVKEDEIKKDEGGRNLKRKDDDRIVDEIMNSEKDVNPRATNKRQGEEKLIAPDDTRPDIYQWRMYKGEILVFKEPEDKLKLTIKTKEDMYKPGDLVEFEVTINDGTLIGDGDVETLINVVVTDDSVYQRLEDKLQPPTFGSAVYLAYDVLNYNYHFNYANHYLEHFFVDKKADYSSDENLELLLATQTWRVGIFDLPMVRDLQYDFYTLEEDEQVRISNLFAGGFYTYDYMVFDDVMEMGPEADGGPVKRDNDEEGGGVDESASTTSTSNSNNAPGSEDVDISELPTDYMTGINPETKYWAHQLRNGYDPSIRVDKTETQFYNAMSKLGRSRKFTGSFYLSDLITKFRITANAIDTKGRIGYQTSSIQTQLPFYLLFEVPTSVAVGDVMKIPVNVKNLAGETLDFTLSVQTDGKLSTSFDSSKTYKVRAKKTETIDIEITAEAITDSTYLYVIGNAVGRSGQEYTDSYISYTSVVSKGFPKQVNGGGFIGTTINQFTIPSSVSFDLSLPDTMEADTYNLDVKIMSSNLASLLEAIESLIGTPTGCFEQTSATSYPMVMGLKFLEDYPVQDETVEDLKFQIKSKLKPAYQKLTSFQTKEDGYEWFGESPAHEALTAYGLLQFKDMQEVTDFVDSDMVSKTQEWLLSRRNSKGGFDLNERSLDSFGGAPEEVNNAYIVWALVRSGQTDGLDDQIDALIELADDQMNNSPDPYILGLVADILYILGDNSEAEVYAQAVASMQTSTGEVTGASTSVTSSSGSNLEIETTSIAVLAWLHDQSTFSTNIKDAVEWITTKVKKGGSYGSTQATILALKALTEYMNNFVSINGQGDFVLYINDNEVQRISFDQDSREAIKFDLEDYISSNPRTFAPGSDLTIELSIENFQRSANEAQEDFQVAYSISSNYFDTEPDGASSDLIFSVSKRFSDGKLGKDSAIGNSFDYRVELENNLSKGSGMVVVVFRVPACLEVNFELLDTLLGNGEVDMYEVTNKNTEVVLYMRTLLAGEQKKLDLGFVQAFAGECYEKPHNAYLYYNDDDVFWVLAE